MVLGRGRKRHCDRKTQSAGKGEGKGSRKRDTAIRWSANLREEVRKEKKSFGSACGLEIILREGKSLVKKDTMQQKTKKGRGGNQIRIVLAVAKNEEEEKTLRRKEAKI